MRRPLTLPLVLTLQEGRALGYAEYGNPKGFPLLYLHGFPSSRLEGSAFDNVACGRNLCIIAPDRPGYGLSTFQPNRRILDYLQDTQSLADHLGIFRFAVLGDSDGGPYAFACAHSLPHDRLAGVGILAGAGPWASGRVHISIARRPVIRWLDNWLEKQEIAEESTLPTEERREMALRMVFEAFAQGGAATVQEAILLAQDWGFRFEDVTYSKIQLCHGQKDALSPIEMIRYMAERLPHCVLREFKGDTHFTVAGHIDEILSRLVPEDFTAFPHLGT
ncbi:alpha/beta fold hydrolase [Aspergillus foveolatus]|uniref:alpha/beta fold hydrolase n=1 Tax=Aspergillus foveolatus TaxID=210207 RepID=UPI003CCD5488